MSIFYTYSLQHLNIPYEILLDQDQLTASLLTFHQICLLLSQDGAKFAPPLHLFNRTTSRIRVFKEKDTIEIGYAEEVVFLLDQLDLSRFETKIQQIEEKIDSYHNSLKQQINELSLSIGSLLSVMPQQPLTPKLTLSVDSLDLAIMFSNPLVHINPCTHNLTPLDDQVDFLNECLRLKHTLETLEGSTAVTLKIDIASQQNLINIWGESPKIIHFICHGVVVRDNNVALAFENMKGEVEEVGTERLREIFEVEEAKNNKTQLIFVNACLSEVVGQLFISAGIPAVICVQQDMKIYDKVAEGFAVHFYKYLFSGYTIRKAFYKAKKSTQIVQGNQNFTCCCAHNHHQNAPCVKNHKTIILHEKHSFVCDCPEAKKLIHLETCSQARNYLLWLHDKDNKQEPSTPKDPFDFCLDESDEEEDILQAYKINTNQNKPGLYICCCYPYQKWEHNEAQKFKLLLSEESFGETVLFQKDREGVFNDLSKFSFEDNVFEIRKIKGQNRILYELFSELVNPETRLIQIHGQLGSGRTIIAQQAANYAHERSHFKDGIKYENLLEIEKVLHLMENVKRIYSQVLDEKLYQFLFNKEILLIFDNCDDLLTYNLDQLRQKLKLFLQKTKYLKIIIITTELKSLNIGEKTIKIPQLEVQSAKNILMAKLLPSEIAKFQDLATLNEILIWFQDKGQLTPKQVELIIEAVKNYRSLKEYYRELMDSKHNGLFNHSQALFNLKENMKAYEFLFFLLEFQHGLCMNDLERLQKLSLIQDDWQSLLDFLINEQEVGGLENELEYFWVKRRKDKTGVEILKVNEFFRKFLENILSSSNREMENAVINYFAKLKYCTLIAMYLMKRLVENGMYYEKLVEFSYLNEEGIWKGDDCNGLNGEMKLIFPDEEKKNSEKEQKEGKMFLIHEKNLLSLFNVQKFANLLNFMKTSNLNEKLPIADYISLLSKAVIIIPTLFKIKSKLNNAIEITSKAIKVVNLLQQNIKEQFPDIQIVNEKLNLILANLYYEECQFFKLKKNKEAQLTASRKLEEQIQTIDTNNNDYLLFDKNYILANHIYINWQFLKEPQQSNTQPVKRDLMKKVLKLIDEIRNNLNKNKDLKSQLTKYFCKLLLLKGMIKISEDLWQYFNEKHQEAKFYTELFQKDIHEIFELLQTMNKKYLMILAYKLKAELVFHKAEKWGIQVLELEQAKKDFVEKALSLSTEVLQFIHYFDYFKDKGKQIATPMSKTYESIQ